MKMQTSMSLVSVVIALVALGLLEAAGAAFTSSIGFILVTMVIAVGGLSLKADLAVCF